ncbi:MAG: chromosome segregation protein SMC [Clostridia bacterium]|nr:chromosome segregation protein SMC [Clostridia bacterium]
MRLKSLELQGFKSFPDKTVINFNRGITVVVGPNGSGKSNISDAMRWVLGEMSSKSIRGVKMEDVIFAGSHKRSPMGYAEVSVVFDNSEEAGKNEELAEYDEIVVTRRYYRVGESEYFINRKSARLKDIVELFLNTGLGKNGYSIIGQGKIAEIISQKSEERRSVFEEVAGIAKYRYQKNEAEKKLAGTDENLTRMADIVSELEGRIGPLERDAEKAKKYLEIYEKKKAADISLSIYDIENAGKSEKELAEKLTFSKHELDSSDETLAEMDEADELLFEKIQVNKLNYERATAKIAEVTAKLHQAQSGILVKENDLSHYRAVLDGAKEKLSTLEASINGADAEYRARLAEYTAAEKAKRETEASLAEITAALAEIASQLRGIDAEKAEIAKDIELLNSQTVEARVAFSVAKSQREAGEQKCRELGENIAKYEEDTKMLSARIEKARAKIDGYAAKEKGFNDEVASLDALRAENERENAILAEKKSKIFIDISQTKVKIQNLINMEELFEGYSRAVKFVMNAHKTGKILTSEGAKPTIYGPVSLLFEVDTQYSLAVETALGGALQNIVTEDEAGAKAAIAYLKRQNGGRATFCPVTTVNGTELDADKMMLTAKRGFVAVASRLVRADSKFAGIIRNMLGRIIVADNIDNAAKLARALDFRYKIVTLDGQVVNAGGSFTGGSAQNGSGMLSRRAQIEKMQADVAAMEKEMAAIVADIKKNEAAMLELKKKKDSILTSLSVLHTMKEAESTQLQVLVSTGKGMEATLAGIREEYDALAGKAARNAGEAKALSEKEKQYAEQIAKLSERAERLSAEREKLTAEELLGRTQQSEKSVALAREEKNLELLLSVAETAKGKAEDYALRREELTESVALATGNIAAANAEIEAYRTTIATAGGTVAGLEREKAELSALSLRMEQEQSRNRAKQKELSHKRELIFREYTRIESAHKSAQEKKDKLLSFLWDEYELSFSAACALGYEKVTEENRTAVVSEQAKCRERIRALGNVNVGAIEEYKEVSERYTFLSAQISDLKTSKEELTKIIFSLEEQMRRDFAATIQLVNTHFGAVFAELFGGGKAEISLTDPENVLESGIEIKAAPPGKVIKSLSLLSGGEQAFIAIALYFAIMKVSPAPFCIMDEIEAALDEVNVDKFADYVKKYSEKTQFVIITHRRGTMEVADTLYGVTMHEKGISQVLSVDIAEIEKKTGVVLN